MPCDVIFDIGFSRYSHILCDAKQIPAKSTELFLLKNKISGLF